ncbi:hypothetical protein BJX64DRAFT_252268 [Aspergillus heterothallicus]
MTNPAIPSKTPYPYLCISQVYIATMSEDLPFRKPCALLYIKSAISFPYYRHNPMVGTSRIRGGDVCMFELSYAIALCRRICTQPLRLLGVDLCSRLPPLSSPTARGEVVVLVPVDLGGQARSPCLFEVGEVFFDFRKVGFLRGGDARRWFLVGKGGDFAHCGELFVVECG